MAVVATVEQCPVVVGRNIMHGAQAAVQAQIAAQLGSVPANHE